MFDFTVEPGKTYEYRMKVRMANPNFGRKDVASQGIAADPELTPKEWYVLPKKLVVPSDLYFYAVDQAKLDQDQGQGEEQGGEAAELFPVGRGGDADRPADPEVGGLPAAPRTARTRCRSATG